MVLILFSGNAFSLPLSRTCYTVPVDTIDLYLGEEFLASRDSHRMDVIAFSLGLTGKTAAGAGLSILNYDLSGNNREAGDVILELWHYTGRYLKEIVDTGISLKVRIPTGPDPGMEEKWKNLSVGRSEIRITPVFSFNVTDAELITFNCSYIFREARGEDFYGGFKWNFTKSETYKSILGLNPFYEDSFMYREKLKDDYVSIACSVIEKRLYPVIFFGEFYHAFNDFKDEKDLQSGSAEGEGASLTMLSAGLKYFIRESVYCSVFGIINPFYTDDEHRWGAGAGINIFF